MSVCVCVCVCMMCVLRVFFYLSSRFFLALSYESITFRPFVSNKLEISKVHVITIFILFSLLIYGEYQKFKLKVATSSAFILEERIS